MSASTEIDRERRRLRATGIVGALLPLVPAAVVAALRGQSPWQIPYYHLAIPIVIVFLVPLAYLLMPLFDGTLLLGEPRLTSARAALAIRCSLTNLIALAGLLVFFLRGDHLTWSAVIWALSLPAAFGTLRRISAYERALERIAAQPSTES